MFEPKGNKHSVAPTYGSTFVPAPEPPTQTGDGVPAGRPKLKTNPVLERMFPVETAPPAAFTVSLKPLTRIVSPPVSTVFAIRAAHVYAPQIFTGLTHC